MKARRFRWQVQEAVDRSVDGFDFALHKEELAIYAEKYLEMACFLARPRRDQGDGPGRLVRRFDDSSLKGKTCR